MVGTLIDEQTHADVAELADAQDSGSCGRKVVEVRFLSSALFRVASLPRPSLVLLLPQRLYSLGGVILLVECTYLFIELTISQRIYS
jgi:hypothetical protein